MNISRQNKPSTFNLFFHLIIHKKTSKIRKEISWIEYVNLIESKKVNEGQISQILIKMKEIECYRQPLIAKNIFCKLLHWNFQASLSIWKLVDCWQNEKKEEIEVFSLTYNAVLMGKTKHLKVKWEFNLSKWFSVLCKSHKLNNFQEHVVATFHTSNTYICLWLLFCLVYDVLKRK